MLALFDNDPELMKLYEETKPPPPLNATDKVKQSDALLEANAVLHYIWNPEQYSEKWCKQCGKLFATNRPAHVSICSVECMKKAIQEIGLDWDPLVELESRYKRMKRLPDMIVPPVILEHLQTLASHNVETQEPPSSATQDIQASYGGS